MLNGHFDIVVHSFQFCAPNHLSRASLKDILKKYHYLYIYKLTNSKFSQIEKKKISNNNNYRQKTCLNKTLCCVFFVCFFLCVECLFIFNVITAFVVHLVLCNLWAFLLYFKIYLSFVPKWIIWNFDVFNEANIDL